MTFRPLSDTERRILNRLLQPDFPGRQELILQLESAEAEVVDKDGSLSLRADRGPDAKVMARVPTEGECPDVDGVNIHILLHVVDGRMNELEVYKEDGSSPVQLPDPDALSLFTPYGEEGVR